MHPLLKAALLVGGIWIVKAYVWRVVRWWRQMFVFLAICTVASAQDAAPEPLMSYAQGNIIVWLLGFLTGYALWCQVSRGWKS